jgi:hypothetical protein
MAFVGNVPSFGQQQVRPQFSGQADLASLQQLLFTLSSLMQPQQPNAEQMARYQAQEREAQARVERNNTYLAEQMARMNAQNAQIQASFQTGVGLTGMESSFNGFLNQVYQPISYSYPNYGSYVAPQPQAPPPTLFGGPISVPTFYAQRSGFGRW